MTRPVYGDWQPEAALYQNRTLVLDANLLVLLIVGLTDRRLINQFGRTKNHFTESDFDRLTNIVEFFAERKGLATTSHVLAETSNLLGERLEFMITLERFVLRVCESRKEATRLVASPIFYRLGLTDAGLRDLSFRSHCILTVDKDLATAAMRGGAILNYNHFRFDV
jgi:hypothetical protein